MRDLINDLIDLLADTAKEMDYADEHERITRLPDNLSFLRQREVLTHAGSMRAVVADLVRQIENGAA